jgi:hypothetical protein
MAGLMEGYLGGLQFVSGIQQMQQQRDQFNFSMRQRRQAELDNQQERGIMTQLARSQRELQTTGDLVADQTRLAQQYRNAGAAVMAVNPQDGMSLLKQADSMQMRSQDAALSQMQVATAKDKLAATKAANVSDQDSLSGYVQDMAKIGRMVPKKYQEWNDGTQEWLRKQELLGTTNQERQQLSIQQRKLELAEQQERLRERREDDRVKYEASKEARLREGLEIKKRSAGMKASSEFGLKGEKERQAEMSVLGGMDKQGAFKSLNPGEQIAAAEDVHMRAMKYRADSMLTEETLSPEEALYAARQEVLGELKVKKGEGLFGTGLFGKDTAERVRGGVERKAPPPVDRQANTQADVQAAASQAWGSYDPARYEYRISPDGRIQRRAK